MLWYLILKASEFSWMNFLNLEKMDLLDSLDLMDSLDFKMLENVDNELL